MTRRIKTKQTWVHVTYEINGSVRVRFEKLIKDGETKARKVGRERVYLPEHRHRLLTLVRCMNKKLNLTYTVYAIDGFSCLFEREVR